MIVLVLLLFILAFIGYYKAKNYITPEVLSPASWGLVLLLYLTVDHGMYNISDKTLFIIALWNISLLTGIYFVRYTNIVTIKNKKYTTEFNYSIRKLYYLITIFGFFPTLYIIYKQATSINAGNLFFNLRMVNTGIIESEYSLGIFEYIITFAFVSYMIELFTYIKSKNKKRVIILFIINFIFAISTMAKTTFLFLFLSTLIVVAYNRKVSIKGIIITLLVIFFLMNSIQFLRTDTGDGTDNKREGVTNMFNTYVFGGIVALDQIVNSSMKSKNEGQNSLVFIDNVKSKIGLRDKVPKEYVNSIAYEGYFYTPYPTNVYTVIGPFWLDYSYKGVIVFSFIIGLFAGYFYKLAVRGVSWGIILNAYFLCVLILQFFGEYIFTNMSYLLQLIILCFIAYKFYYKIIWRKSISYSPHIRESNI
ncbi:MAG: O-antigen polymerase [Bacteroidaceae bacterium]|nr:O-antigen polymerase [Bacteroidaceae bacterium]